MGTGSDDIDDDAGEAETGAGEGGQQEDIESSLDEESGAFVEDIVVIDCGDQGGGTSLGVDPSRNLFGDLAHANDINGASFGDDAGVDELVVVVTTARHGIHLFYVLWWRKMVIEWCINGGGEDKMAEN